MLEEIKTNTAKRHAEIVEQARESNNHISALVQLVGELVGAVKSSLNKNIRE